VKTKYDAVILGAGHNGLVAAGYLARAGLSVLLLEKNPEVGGATASQKVFPDYEAYLSRYSYLVSLLPEKIVRDLGLRIELRTRKTASFTPYARASVDGGLLLSNLAEAPGRDSMRALCGDDREFEQLKRFYVLSRVFAGKVWESMVKPLRAREDWAREFTRDELSREAWRSLVEEPLGQAIERYLSDDLVRGLVLTDGKIGLLTHAHDETLLQNRCFLYHLIGGGTGEWKVPVGGMGSVVRALVRTAEGAGAEMLTRVEIKALDFGERERRVEYEAHGKRRAVDAQFVLVNFGRNVLAKLLGRKHELDETHEGSVLKVNMLLERLPRLRAGRISAEEAFCGTFHVDEGYGQMNESYRKAAGGSLPDRVPCELYCHTLTDGSILAPELMERGFHTLTLFALDTPWRLFAEANEAMRRKALGKCLEGLNRCLAEPIEECLARSKSGEPCIEAKTPVDLEDELGLYRGNIFQGALKFPFAEREDEIGAWGVETEFPNVLMCGASARRGGGVSGIPGHNAAMKVMESLKAKLTRI
jgi:phytoene dehydrogenase-like protein